LQYDGGGTYFRGGLIKKINVKQFHHSLRQVEKINIKINVK
jgi:hypothetical protein